MDFPHGDSIHGTDNGRIDNEGTGFEGDAPLHPCMDEVTDCIGAEDNDETGAASGAKMVKMQKEVLSDCKLSDEIPVCGNCVSELVCGESILIVHG